MIIGQQRVKPSKGQLVTWQGKRWRVKEVGLKYLGLEDPETGLDCGHLIHVNEVQIAEAYVAPVEEEEEL